VLNVDLKPFDHPGINTLIADLTDSGQAFNALSTHFGVRGFQGRQAAGGARRRGAFRAIPRVLNRTGQRDLSHQRHQHLQRHRGGGETRRPQDHHRFQRNHLRGLLCRGRQGFSQPSARRKL
jgi:hypothetical protein